MQRASAGLIVLVATIVVVSNWARIGQAYTYDDVPKRISVINAAHDIDDIPPNYETNEQAVNDIAGLGMRAVKIWPRVSYQSAEMAAVFTNSDIDVIVLRPLENCDYEPSPCDPSAIELRRWENIDYVQVAEYLYSHFGDEQKVIILTNWESDNQFVGWGQGCDEVEPPEPEILAYLDLLDYNQAGIQQVRIENLEKNLRVFNAVEVNRVMGVKAFEVVDKVIPRMAQSPDFVSFSRWYLASPISDELDYIELCTGLPRSRIFVGEVGTNEGYPTDWQYPYYIENIDAAMTWGVDLLFTWIYRQQWGGTNPNDPGFNLGIHEKDANGQFTGDMTSGFTAMQEMMEKWESPFGPGGPTESLEFERTLVDEESMDGPPSHFFDGTTHHLYWRRETEEIPGGGWNAIFYSMKDGELESGGWSAPVEVLNNFDISWSSGHVGDPAILKGQFSYNSQNYTLALYFTTNPNPPDGPRVIGVAFSNDGMSWDVASSPVISPELDPPGDYGVGMGGVAFSEDGLIQQIYLDSSVSENSADLLRLRYSSDSISFFPSDSLRSEMASAGRDEDGQSPDIAYSPLLGRWFGTIKCTDSNQNYWGETRFLRGNHDLQTAWAVSAEINSLITDLPQNQSASLAKNEDSTLLIDSGGYAHILLCTGNDPPDTDNWRLSLAHKRVTQPAFARDTFSRFARSRPDGSPLEGTFSEQGSKEWLVNAPGLEFNDGAVTPSETIPEWAFMGSLEYPIEMRTEQSVVWAEVDPAGSGWVAIGFAGTQNDLLHVSSPLWMLINPDDQHIEIWKNGLSDLVYVGPAPGYSSESNFMELSVNNSVGRASIRFNDTVVVEDVEVDISSAGFASFQITNGTADQTNVRGFAVDWRPLIFVDGFESGSTDEWSSTCPPDCDP